MDQCVVAIGNFDGVHQGHRRVLELAQADSDLPLTVITFWPHPIEVLRPERAPKLLTDLESRIALLREAGAHQVRVVPFDRSVAALSPAEFVETFVMPLNPARVVVGANFRFGAGARGDVRVLTELGEQHGFEVIPSELLMIHDDISCSTRIRELIVAGDVAEAALHLGRPVSFEGVVVVGDQRGRELGFPTANLTVSDDVAVPADGVYAGWFSVEGGEPMGAAISVGSNPTFDGTQRRVESYVIDEEGLELYGSHVKVDFVTQLRGQIKFTGIDDLITQMERDVQQCREVLGIA